MLRPKKGDKLIGPYAKPKVRCSGWVYQPGTLELGFEQFILLDSVQWLAWLEQELAFRIEQMYYLADQVGLEPCYLSCTVPPERRQRGQVYWYPYKMYRNRRLRGIYLGKSEAVSLIHLEQLALQFLSQIDPDFYHQVCQVGLLSFPKRSPSYEQPLFETDPTADPLLAKVPQPAVAKHQECDISVIKGA